MGQIMQRLLEGVQAELQAEERDLCAHLNAQAHLVTLEANLEGHHGTPTHSPKADVKGKGKQAAVPVDEPAASGSTVRGKRKLSAGEGHLRLRHITKKCCFMFNFFLPCVTLFIHGVYCVLDTCPV